MTARNSLNLRPVDPASLDAVAALEASASPEAWTRKALSDSLNAGHRGFMLCNDEGQPLAHCMLSVVLDECELLIIAVVPEHRRQGLARTLLTQLIQGEFAQHQWFLEVRASNSAARELYQTLGFESCGLRKAYYPGLKSPQREDAILMRRLPTMHTKGSDPSAYAGV